jgi:hemolysin D
MDRSTIDVDGSEVNLSPGMAVSAEVKTGRRRVIEYFLSPLLQYGHESLKER